MLKLLRPIVTIYKELLWLEVVDTKTKTTLAFSKTQSFYKYYNLHI